MTTAAKKVLEEALALSEEERAELVAALTDSLERPTLTSSEAWTREVEDRIGQIERGEVELVAWEAVEARIRATLGRH